MFVRSGNLKKLKKWHSAAIDRYVQSTFDRTCELLSDRIKIIRYDGWPRAKKWWPEIIERAFRKTPFTPLHALILNHNNKTIRSPYDHARCSKDREDIKYIQEIYGKIFKEYIEENFDHALEYIFRDKRLLWEKVPEKWHKEFLKKCFEQNPFRGACEILKLTHKGKTVNSPADYYRRIGRHDDLAKMMNEIFNEYLSSTDRVAQFISHSNFTHFQGWKAVSEKYRRALIINAILQSKSPQPKIKDLIYAGKEGKSVKIENLYGFYLKTKQKSIFEQHYREGIEFKNRFAAESKKPNAPKTVDNQAESKQTDLIPQTLEEIKEKAKRAWMMNPIENDKLKELILKAQNGGGAQARFLIARMFGKLIYATAKKFAYGNETVLEDLVQDGIEKAEECVRHFDFNKSENFEGYLRKSLTNEFITRSLIYNRGYSEKQIANIGARIRELRKLSRDKSTDYLEMPAEKIAEITKCKIKTALRGQKIIKSKFISLEDSAEGYDDKTIADFMPDDKFYKPENAAEKQEIADVISVALLTLELKEQVILKQTFDIKGINGTSPYQLKEAFKDLLSIPEIINAAEIFHQKLKEFCVNTEFENTETVEKLKTAIEISKNPEDTINGENALGRLLLDNIDFRIKNIFVHILLSLDTKDRIILSEIFNIPCKPHTGEELGEFFDVSRASINHTLNHKIYPQIRMVLQSKNCPTATDVV